MSGISLIAIAAIVGFALVTCGVAAALVIWFMSREEK